MEKPIENDLGVISMTNDLTPEEQEAMLKVFAKLQSTMEQNLREVMTLMIADEEFVRVEVVNRNS